MNALWEQKTETLQHFEANEDGHAVDVMVTSMPAEFYTVIAHDRVDYDGETVKGFTLLTGSGERCRRLALEIAAAISEGILGLEQEG